VAPHGRNHPAPLDEVAQRTEKAKLRYSPVEVMEYKEESVPVPEFYDLKKELLNSVQDF
jgi:hypothetical protein